MSEFCTACGHAPHQRRRCRRPEGAKCDCTQHAPDAYERWQTAVTLAKEATQTEWKALEAWWEGYKAMLPHESKLLTSGDASMLEVFGLHPADLPTGYGERVEAAYRERRQKTIDAIEAIWRRVPEEPLS